MLKKLLCLSFGAVACSGQASTFTHCSNSEIGLDFRPLQSNQTHVIVNYKYENFELSSNHSKNEQAVVFKSIENSSVSSLVINLKKDGFVEVALETMNGKVTGLLRCSQARK